MQLSSFALFLCVPNATVWHPGPPAQVAPLGGMQRLQVLLPVVR